MIKWAKTMCCLNIVLAVINTTNSVLHHGLLGWALVLLVCLNLVVAAYWMERIWQLTDECYARDRRISWDWFYREYPDAEDHRVTSLESFTPTYSAQCTACGVYGYCNNRYCRTCYDNHVPVSDRQMQLQRGGLS